MYYPSTKVTKYILRTDITFWGSDGRHDRCYRGSSTPLKIYAERRFKSLFPRKTSVRGESQPHKATILEILEVCNNDITHFLCR